MLNTSIPLIRAAIELAAEAHANQFRRVNARPYLLHVVQVGFLLQSVGADEELVAAGILHDVLEDKPSIGEKQLLKAFGERITRLVLDMTEPDNIKGWRNKKEIIVHRMASASRDLRLVATADKVDNLETIARTRRHRGEKVWNSLKAPKAEMSWYYHAIYTSLAAGAPGDFGSHPLIKRMAALIEDLFRGPETD